MIGVVATESDHRIVSEFFELFKTPWEYLRSGLKYDVILCVGASDFDRSAAKLILHYADCGLPIDAEEGFDVTVHQKNKVLSYARHSLVVYGTHLTFRDVENGKLVLKDVDEQWSYSRECNGITEYRIGYDLFAEISTLLTVGQPREFAEAPTVELHIAILRDLIVESGIELVEIPPVPEGYGCIACLTHDIDHPAIKNHKWDSTAFGFLYRATAGSLANLLRGRLPIRGVVKNWIAALKLPLVYAGLAKDFWGGFEDRYRECDMGFCSTYFVIPFRDYAGNDLNGAAPRRRAAGYAAKEIKDALGKIQTQGSEVALHGIDAWRDSESARKELNEVRQFVPDVQVGVRMHWLFYSEKSPLALEKAGASYDSTIGYRDTVGFRTGTTQVYRPIEATRLLELPMHVMDTALFYPAYLGLSQRTAESHVRALIATVAEFGGCLTLNWHDRSLASERNWDSCYRALLDELRRRGAWFATAGQVTSWFQMRRSVVFEKSTLSSTDACAKITAISAKELPALRLRFHKLDRDAGRGGAVVRRYRDVPLVWRHEEAESRLEPA